jgi:hypothetical protein
MIPTNKSEPKHLGIKGTKRAQKSNKNSPKKTRKSHKLREGNQRNHESFHTLRGQILYEVVKKSMPMEQEIRSSLEGWFAQKP